MRSLLGVVLFGLIISGSTFNSLAGGLVIERVFGP